MAKSLIVKFRFPFFRFYARMGDAQVDGELRHEDAAIRRSALGELVQLGKLYLGYLTKPASNHAHSEYDAAAAYATPAEEDEAQFNHAGGGESRNAS